MGRAAPILVTGAAGKTGQAVIGALRRSDAPVRAFVRHLSQPARPDDGVEQVCGDMRDPAAWAAAVDGVEAMYLICPNMMPDEQQVAAMALSTAQRAGVERVVYHSVLHPQIEAMPHHWNKMRVEEALFATELCWTVLQPAAYMQNVFAGWDAIARDGAYRVPYGIETRLSMVDLNDVAEVATTVLLESSHVGAIYELAGPEVLSQVEVAEALSAALGRPVEARRISADVWEATARASGLGDLQIDMLLAMFRYYDRYGFWGNDRVLRWLLGRPTTTFSEALARARI